MIRISVEREREGGERGEGRGEVREAAGIGDKRRQPPKTKACIARRGLGEWTKKNCERVISRMDVDLATRATLNLAPTGPSNKGNKNHWSVRREGLFLLTNGWPQAVIVEHFPSFYIGRIQLAAVFFLFYFFIFLIIRQLQKKNLQSIRIIYLQVLQLSLRKSWVLWMIF